jgi:hypothetical protein
MPTEPANPELRWIRNPRLYFLKNSVQRLEIWNRAEAKEKAAVLLQDWRG